MQKLKNSGRRYIFVPRKVLLADFMLYMTKSIVLIFYGRHGNGSNARKAVEERTDKRLPKLSRNMGKEIL